MTMEIELAKQNGIQYRLTPEGTTEMWCHDRDVQAFAEAVRAAACAELRRLEAENLHMDRLMRASVPDQWKSCTSPVGAVQSYIAELEAANAELLEALKHKASIEAAHGIKGAPCR